MTILRVGSFTVFDFHSAGTTSATVELDGSGFLPVGASCTLTTSLFAPPSCTCSFGSVAVGHWTNSATGAAGQLELTLIGNASCEAIQTRWRTPAIALAPGSNPITLSLTDSATEGGAVMTIVRHRGFDTLSRTGVSSPASAGSARTGISRSSTDLQRQRMGAAGVRRRQCQRVSAGRVIR